MLDCNSFELDPGEVAVCFGDEGTWCPLYKDDNNGQIHQEYSDGEETASSLSSDDDLVNLTQNVQTLNVNETDLSSKKIQNSNNSRTSSPFFNSNNDEQKIFWSQQLSTTYSNQQENFSN